MKVSRREALLLFILAFIGILGMMVAFIVFPLTNTINTNKLVLQDLESRKLVIDTTLPNLQSLEKRLATRLSEVSEVLHLIETPVNEAQFEQWVLPLTTEYNMRIIETSFTEPIIVSPIALNNIPIEQYYEIRQLVEEYNQIEPLVSKLPTSESLLLKTDYVYTVKTTYARYVYFLDDVTSWDTTIYVSSSSYDFEESVANFTLSVYTVHQLLPDEIEKDYTKDIVASGTGKGDSNEDPHPEGGK